jgi:hypothetical protein
MSNCQDHVDLHPDTSGGNIMLMYQFKTKLPMTHGPMLLQT